MEKVRKLTPSELGGLPKPAVEAVNDAIYADGANEASEILSQGEAYVPEGQALQPQSKTRTFGPLSISPERAARLFSADAEKLQAKK